jgi:formate hydrogenlyase subunit 4
MSSTLIALTLAHVLAVLLMPFALIGVINRSKSWWAGRKGPRLTQSFHDLRRLLGKRPVVSSVTSPVFRLGAWVVLVTALVVMGMSPLLGQFAPLQFSHDFIAVAYILGLGRLMLMLSAMDVGSPFEGMGASREAMFGAFAEPALFLLIGTASAATGLSSFADLLGQLHHTSAYLWIVGPLCLALLILLQTEAARVPVDDPATHLELTMIHEVMILDHSGPELAAMQYAAGLKLTLYAGLIATLLNPLDLLTAPLAAVATSLILMLAVAVVVGTVESVVARLPLRWVTHYVWLAGWCVLLAALVVGMAGGGL